MILAIDDLATVGGAGWLRVADGKVVEVGSGDAPGVSAQHVEGLVLPGFVDIHAHGALGYDFSTASDPQVREVADFHLSYGTTTLVASVATAPLGTMRAAIARLAPLVREGAIAAIHLEGPYLSAVQRGAHDVALLRNPDTAELAELLALGEGAIRVVTIAPELPRAHAAIEMLARRGVAVAIGHSDADAATAAAAIDSGASVVTHVFNGMRPLHHRDAGLVGAALTDERVALEVIVDGHHLSDEAVELVRRTAAGRYLLVSDAMAATGLGDGAYSVAGSPVRVEAGVARVPDTGSLAGSTGVIATAARRLRDTHGASADELVDATSRVARRVLGLPPEELRVGDPADLVVLGDDTLRVMKGGRWVA